MKLHKDKDLYFEIQRRVTEAHIIPFLGKHLNENSNICEVGCAEAGVLKAFLDQGHNCVGIELSDYRLQLAKQFLAQEEKEGRAYLYNKNIFDKDILNSLPFKFDLIILKDVIEHLPNKENVLATLSSFLKPNGLIFFAFPPWWMPFGGHQQITKNKVLKHLPYVHLLPNIFYKKLLSLTKERESTTAELMELTETGINIGAMRKLLNKEGYVILKDKHWLFNPIYEYKFGVKPKTVLAPFKNLIFLRNFYTSCYYVLFKPEQA